MIPTPNPSHRPRGGPAQSIQVRARGDRDLGRFLYIGLDLYDSIGAPRLVAIDRLAEGWCIKPAPPEHFDYTVSNGNVSSPRIAMGDQVAVYLRLEVGIYRAMVMLIDGPEIHFWAEGEFPDDV